MIWYVLAFAVAVAALVITEAIWRRSARATRAREAAGRAASEEDRIASASRGDESSKATSGRTAADATAAAHSRRARRKR